jgi:hypothetical protein
MLTCRPVRGPPQNGRRRWYAVLTWDALLAMFPGRTQPAITREVGRMGLARPRGGPFSAVAPLVFPVPEERNEMASYGFRAATTGPPEGDDQKATPLHFILF